MRRKEEEDRALAAQHSGVAEGCFVQNASLQQGRGVRELGFHLVEREGFCGEHEAAPSPASLRSKPQLSGWHSPIARHRADFVTFSKALAVFWLLHPEGFKFSVPLSSRRQQSCAWPLLVGAVGIAIPDDSCSIGSLYAIKKQLVLGLVSSAPGYL